MLAGVVLYNVKRAYIYAEDYIYIYSVRDKYELFEMYTKCTFNLHYLVMH